MAFTIKKITGIDTAVLAYRIEKEIETSRFTADIRFDNKVISIHTIRLKQSKDYCGNHPLPCPIRPGVHKPHIHSKCLEGTDWVVFNDSINNILDSLNVSADVATSLVKIRKGFERCVKYSAQRLSNGIDNEWIKDSGQFKNCIGQIAKTDYPLGTPGLYSWV